MIFFLYQYLVIDKISEGQNKLKRKNIYSTVFLSWYFFCLYVVYVLRFKS